MGTKIYKYFSAETLPMVFAKEETCSIKCSLPVDYNDPFELFLGIDPNCGPELLAVYREIVYEIPQQPTTCFSKSPIVTPMWAHYARNHSGFALEFDLETLKSTLPEAAIGDVVYRDEPDARIEDALLRAAVAKKPRHAIWLRQGVFSAAYFSKHSCWAYEQECRLVVGMGTVADVGGNMILNIPLHAVTSLIVGKNFPENLMDESRAIAASGELNWYEEVIGKSHPQPYFRSGIGDISVFGESGIQLSANTCGECSEPVAIDCELCPWCSIQEHDEEDAARSNPLRILDHYGALEGYLAEVANIERSRKR